MNNQPVTTTKSQQQRRPRRVLIADCGGTSCTWCYITNSHIKNDDDDDDFHLDDDRTKVDKDERYTIFRVKGQGFNPFLHSDVEMKRRIEDALMNNGNNINSNKEDNNGSQSISVDVVIVKPDGTISLVDPDETDEGDDNDKNGKRPQKRTKMTLSVSSTLSSSLWNLMLHSTSTTDNASRGGEEHKLLPPSSDVPVRLIDEIHFYGAGCETTETSQKVHCVLRSIDWTTATGATVKDSSIDVSSSSHPLSVCPTIYVHHDLVAAARATSIDVSVAKENDEDRRHYVAILGTGSNSCIYNKTTSSIMEQGPSLGYLLGDEGSGCDLGKALIQQYLLGKMPTDVATKFKHQYDPNGTILQHVYDQNPPNTYLANLTHFFNHAKHLSLSSQTYLDELAKSRFRQFVQINLFQYNEAKIINDDSNMPIESKSDPKETSTTIGKEGQKQQPIKVHFVGSVAYHFQHLLCPVLREYTHNRGGDDGNTDDGILEKRRQPMFEPGVFVLDPIFDRNNPQHSLVAFHILSSTD